MCEKMGSHREGLPAAALQASSSPSYSLTLSRLERAVHALGKEQKARGAILSAIHDLVLAIARCGTAAGFSNGAAAQIETSGQLNIDGLATPSGVSLIAGNAVVTDTAADVEYLVRLATASQGNATGENEVVDGPPGCCSDDLGLPAPPPAAPQAAAVHEKVVVCMPEGYEKRLDEGEERRKGDEEERRRLEDRKKRREARRKRYEEKRKREEEDEIKAAEMRRLKEETRRQKLQELKGRRRKLELGFLRKEQGERIKAQRQLEAKRKMEIVLKKKEEEEEVELRSQRNRYNEKETVLEKEELRKNELNKVEHEGEGSEQGQRSQQVRQQRPTSVGLSVCPESLLLPIKRGFEQMSMPISPVTTSDTEHISSPGVPCGGVNGHRTSVDGSLWREKLKQGISGMQIQPLKPKTSGKAADIDDMYVEITKLDPNIAYSMAFTYHERDLERCLRLLLHAAALAPNNREIVHALACMLLKGTRSIRADAKGAMKLLENNVSARHIDSMLTLAEILRTGMPQENIVRRAQDAARLCRLILEIEPNNTSAMIIMGDLCWEREDPSRLIEGETRAYKLFSRAASLGSIDGEYRKGYWLVTMAPYHRSTLKAFKGRQLIEQAAEKGHADALFFLGYCYEFPNRYKDGLFDFAGDKLSYEKHVYHFYKRAAEAGHGDALNNVGCCVCAGYAGLKPDFDVAREHYEHAIEAGSRDAYDNLAMLYETGMDRRFPGCISYTMALHYYQLGAERNVPQCLMHLGNAYEDGLEAMVKPDRRKAETYYCKALQLAREYGEEDAENQTREDLELLYLMNTRVSAPEEAERSKKALSEMVSANSYKTRMKKLDDALYAVFYERGSVVPLQELVGESNTLELLVHAKTQVEKAIRGEQVDLTQLFGRKTKMRLIGRKN